MTAREAATEPGVSAGPHARSAVPLRPRPTSQLTDVQRQQLGSDILGDLQQPVEELPAQGADDPFADRVCSGRLRWAGENPDALRLEHGVEGACAVPDQELD
jgi:hypothetical protein